MAGLGRVFVGVSGSPGSIRALRYAAQVAYADNASLVTVLAWVPPGGELADRRTPSPYLSKVWERAASQRLHDALASAWGQTPAEVSIQLVVARGEAGHVLVDLADADGDLLVVGAGDQAPLTRFWHGRVARYCLAHASCPVLAVPPSALARQARGLRRWVLRRRAFDAARLPEVPGKQPGQSPDTRR